jgi:Zn-dependent metalloprotease
VRRLPSGERLPQLAAASRICLVRAREDEAFPRHTISRYDHLVNGVPVWGPQLVQHTDEDGRTIAVFGTFVEDPRIETRPTLRADQAERIAHAKSGSACGAPPPPSSWWCR